MTEIVKRNVNSELSANVMQEHNKISGILSDKLLKKYRPHLLKIIIALVVLVLVLTSLVRLLHTNHVKEERLTSMPGKEDIAKKKTAAAVKEYITNVEIKTPNDLLVLYAYYETADSRANIVHFLIHGLHARADFVFVINGESDIDKLLPESTPNIKVIRRNNTCYDLGTHGEVLRMNESELVKKYKKFILMNGSVRGPFLPTYVNGCWSDMFIERLNDKVKLVGTTFNYWAGHCQSMVLATDRTGIDILLAGNETDSTELTDEHYRKIFNGKGGNPESLVGLSKCPENMFKAVSAEISITALIRRAGYEFSVMMTSITSALEQDNHESNINENAYNLKSVHPYEVIFIKSRQGSADNIDSDQVDKLTRWHDNMSRDSWRTCGTRK